MRESQWKKFQQNLFSIALKGFSRQNNSPLVHENVQMFNRKKENSPESSQFVGWSKKTPGASSSNSHPAKSLFSLAYPKRRRNLLSNF